MSSYITSLSQTTGTGISVIICVVSAALYVMSKEDSTARLFFALLAVISAVIAAAFITLPVSIKQTVYSLVLVHVQLHCVDRDIGAQ